MPYHLPTSASLNAAAAAALSWAKRAASKRSPKTTLTQQLQEKILDLARVADITMSSQMELPPHLNEPMTILPLPHPPLSPLSEFECSSSQSGSSETFDSVNNSQSSFSKLSSSVESFPSSQVKKPLVSVPQDDYFFLYLAPRPKTPVFAPCQSEFMSSVFEDDSEDEEPALRKAATKKYAKKSKLGMKKPQPYRLHASPSKLLGKISF